MVDIIRFSIPFLIFIPFASMIIITKYILDNYDIIQEFLVYNKYYQYGLLFIILLLIYILCSFVLSGFVIWSYKPKLSYPYENISNRGERISFPENTIESIKRALNGGAQVVLIDIQLTKDKKVVLIRNEDLSSIGGNYSGKIKNLNYSELPKLVLTEKQKGLLQNSKIDEDQLQIPLLDEIFKEFPDIPFILNFVSDSTELVDIVNELIKEYDRESITIWGSFDHEKIGRYLFETNKKIPLFFSWSRIVRIVFYDFIGALPFININESVLISRNIKKYSFLKYKLNMHMNARGIPVFVFSNINDITNDINVLENIRKVRANGIIADDSRLLTEYLNSVIEKKRKERENHINKYTNSQSNIQNNKKMN
ncbi:PLC-like phosphodiesterase [Neocallimastix lanati (nom. inval.)]|jgi:hypothetical protein|uniref:PLC-like phosphodiesterase n=1 Tax=Neocallimastix californiae TaxID=1754190 RepID=A0A1Y2EN92_9FUNG|nr:PLC-like phosphodiesterase [Neocallimastix sp. JGI-2020a]ORY72315.1 PLC-like phosphodiesterase [Neocallimastix californiae]|eukprot:ORY72315.1 PLC-like phosphodiesterase [Neocallimastix californiae]